MAWDEHHHLEDENTADLVRWQTNRRQFALLFVLAGLVGMIVAIVMVVRGPTVGDTYNTSTCYSVLDAPDSASYQQDFGGCDEARFRRVGEVAVTLASSGMALGLGALMAWWPRRSPAVISGAVPASAGEPPRD